MTKISICDQQNEALSQLILEIIILLFRQMANVFWSLIVLDYKSYLVRSIYQLVQFHLLVFLASSPFGPLRTHSPAKSLIWLMIMGALKFKLFIEFFFEKWKFLRAHYYAILFAFFFENLTKNSVETPFLEGSKCLYKIWPPKWFLYGVRHISWYKTQMIYHLKASRCKNLRAFDFKKP